MVKVKQGALMLDNNQTNKQTKQRCPVHKQIPNKQSKTAKQNKQNNKSKTNQKQTNKQENDTYAPCARTDTTQTKSKTKQHKRQQKDPPLVVDHHCKVANGDTCLQR